VYVGPGRMMVSDKLESDGSGQIKQAYYSDIFVENKKANIQVWA